MVMSQYWLSYYKHLVNQFVSTFMLLVVAPVVATLLPVAVYRRSCVATLLPVAMYCTVLYCGGCVAILLPVAMCCRGCVACCCVL